MRNIILFDNPDLRTSLLPLTYTRPIADILIGIDTIAEKWHRMLPGRYSYRSADYLSKVFPTTVDPADNTFIASHLLPSPALAAEIEALKINCALTDSDGNIIAARTAGFNHIDKATATITNTPIKKIRRPFDIFLLNFEAIADDFKQLTADVASQPLSDSCTVIGNPDDIFIAEGATVEGAFFNTTHGPVYIGPGAEVMEGSCLRGPIAIGEQSTVNMATKIYGGTTIGAHCKVGGEINNVVMFPYSNKAHDGFLGNAVVGSWCNLGAGCVASNLKNDYTEIKLWDYASRRFLRTGLQFCGLIMGDHSKAGINTMFNTATVTGVGVNIHGTGFPRNFVASFSEGSATTGFTDVALTKFFAIAQRVMARRGIELTDSWREVFEHIHAAADQLK